MIDVLVALVFFGFVAWFLYHATKIVIGITGGLFSDPTKRS